MICLNLPCRLKLSGGADYGAFNQSELSKLVSTDDDADLRDKLSDLLCELDTDWQQRAYSSQEINTVVTQLQRIPAQDYASKLKVAGFTTSPYFHPEDRELEQSCYTCMYYVTHRQFCALPELKFPVLPEWSCRLWRI